MSTEDTEKIIGRLVIEHQAAKEQAHLVAERLRSLGQSLLTISQQLKEGQFEAAHHNLEMFRNDIVDLAAVARLIEEHREATERLSALTAKLADMGIVLAGPR
jgi:DNA-binding ferritin-like protein